MTLKQYIGWNPKEQRARRGAVSRLAEFLNVHPSTVGKFLRGEWEPCKETKAQMQGFVDSRVAITPMYGKNRPASYRAKKI